MSTNLSSANPGAPQATPEPPPRRGSQRRAVRNTGYRAVGEVIGRFASLVMFAEAARKLGQSGLGVFVFAMAVTGTIMAISGVGLDRYLLRLIAARHGERDTRFFNVMALKLALGLPLSALMALGLYVAGYGLQTQEMAWVLVPGVLSDSLARTQLALFSAHERGGPPAAADLIQRTLSALLGIIALRLGYNVVAVGASYSIGSSVGVLIGFVLMRRTVGIPAFSVSAAGWREMAVGSFPFAAQDVLNQLLARADAVLLSILATEAAVGLYGAVYRLFESTLFIPYALVGAFAAMFTYLQGDRGHGITTAYQRSVKLALILVLPFTVVFVILPGAICRIIYGPHFASAADALRLLGPATLLIALVVVTSSLVVSRGNPRRINKPTAITVVINVILNLILIPLYGATGAAAAMLITEIVFMVAVGRLAAGVLGSGGWLTAVAGPLVAAGEMAIVCVLLGAHFWLAAILGSIAYVIALGAVEWLQHPLSPQDVRQLVVRQLRR